MTRIEIEIDDDTFEVVRRIIEELHCTPETAVKVFLRQMASAGKFPFEITGYEGFSMSEEEVALKLEIIRKDNSGENCAIEALRSLCQKD